ncbi:hypothetical protein GGR50DRAFT_515490 [Xylaria sp. CBS 124048]|nr:hypothetical protein GGR50DRAFT_515490 [Xylaria sp. CBS 124048]
MRGFPIVNKARKPKFELHLWIYDLNNVPLVAGTSCVKWNFPNIIHGEYRGRTAKCSIDKVNHRVTYNYSRAVSLRISIDRSNNLSECPIEFEVLQEFPVSPGGRDERISLGTVRLNLSEYVEESESFPRRSTASRLAGSLEHAREKGTNQYAPHRKPSVGRAAVEAERPGVSASGGPVQHPEETDLVDEEAEEGIVRRYLLQDSRINSTLRIGILMVQVDGERNYIAPPLKSATVFMGGISALIPGTSEQVDAEDAAQTASALSNISKSRNAEAQDMYRRALAASWDCQPGELHADECIEDIFAGGNGWRDGTGTKSIRSLIDSPNTDGASSISSRSSTTSGDDALSITSRSSNIHHLPAHMRPSSVGSDRSNITVRGRHDHDHNSYSPTSSQPRQSLKTPQPSHQFDRRGRQPSPLRTHLEDSGVSLSDESFPPSLGDAETQLRLARTLGAIRSAGSATNRFRRPREFDEHELRDNLIAWKLPGTVT